MAGDSTYPVLTGSASYREFTMHLVDVSGDTWTEQLFVALSATYAAIEAWIQLYQLTTQASVYQVDEVRTWAGENAPDVNADSGARSGIENGLNCGLRNPTTRDYLALRIVAPDPGIMLGSADIPDTTATAFSDLMTATLALMPGYDHVTTQYTSRREKKNNPKVK